MDSLISEKRGGRVYAEKNDFRSSICYYFSIIIVLITFIFSAVSLGLCSTSTIMQKIYTYKFPYLPEYAHIPKDTPVSVCSHGYVWPGAGLTIYRDATIEEITHDMKNVKTKKLDDDLILAAYDGGVTAFKGTFRGKVFQTNTVPLLDKNNNPIVVRELVSMGNRRFIVVSNQYFVPIEVMVTRDENKVHIDILTGKHYHLPNDDDQFPHVDAIGDNKFAIVYESGTRLMATYGLWEGEGSSSKLEVSEPIQVYLRLNFHGVAGLDANHFVVAATGPVYNSTVPTPLVVSWLVSIHGRFMVVSDIINLPWKFSDNWFSMDNIGSRHIIMVYADAITNGINGVMITYDNVTNTVSFGANAVFQKGGAVLNYNKMDITVLDHQKFAITYEDTGSRSLNMIMGARTDSNDIVITSSTYVVSKLKDGPFDDVLFDVAAFNSEHFGIVEVKTAGYKRTIHFDLVATYARMMGIAKKDGKGEKSRKHDHSHSGTPVISTVELQLGGIITLSGKKKLTPGRAIFTNSYGELIESHPYGYVTRDFGHFYVVDKESNSILDQKNLVGIAVTKKKIKMKF